MIEIPPQFAGMAPVNPEAQISHIEHTWSRAQGLAEDVRYYGEWMKQQAFKEIAYLYPTIHATKECNSKENAVVAWIWARTVASPDPTAHNAYVPLVSSFMLSKKKNNKAWVEIVEDQTAKDGWRFEVKTGNLSKDEEAKKSFGTKAGKGKDFICCLTNSPISRSYIQSEGKAGRLFKRLMAIVTLDKNGRVYLSPEQYHEQIGLVEDESEDIQEAKMSFLNGKTPTRAMITGGVCSAYGLDTWGTLFTGRQIKMLKTFNALIPEVQKKVEADAIIAGMSNDHIPLSKGGNGAKAYGDAVGVYLAFTISKLADRGSSICSWDSSREGLRNTFGRQAIPMVWDFAEGNPFCNSSGCFDNMLEWVIKCILELPASSPAEASQAIR